MKITCTACGAEYELSAKQVRNRLSQGVLYRYLVCPECGSAYLSTVIDDEMRRAMRKKTPSVQLQALSRQKVVQYFDAFRALVPEAQEA